MCLRKAPFRVKGFDALWLVISLGSVCVAAAEPQVTPAGGIYRQVGAGGVVEFNDTGVGERVVIAATTPVDLAEQARLERRTQDILEVASLLAADRLTRESAVLAQLEQRERERERERIGALQAAADAAYYPARSSGAYFPFATGGFRARNSHPYSFRNSGPQRRHFPPRGHRSGRYDESRSGRPPQGQPPLFNPRQGQSPAAVGGGGRQAPAGGHKSHFRPQN